MQFLEEILHQKIFTLKNNKEMTVNAVAEISATGCNHKR